MGRTRDQVAKDSKRLQLEWESAHPGQKYTPSKGANWRYGRSKGGLATGKRYRKGHPHVVARIMKRWSLKAKFGLSLEEYERMLHLQNGVCALCRKPPTKTTPSTMALHVDHCHQTGRVRALLCQRCNCGLGNFEDSPAALRAAADYLERHGV